MRWVARLARCAGAASLGVVLAAHVGSPDVYYTGTAGPYIVDVAIRPPQVVPGIADVHVHVRDSVVTSVVIRPVYWRAGAKGAPSGDEAKPVLGSPGSFAGQLWLMASGTYSVYVTVRGRAGSGTLIVPVAAVPTGTLALTPLLKVLLGVLGALLVAGVVTAIYCGAGESQVAPGEPVPAERRRKARKAVLITVPVMGFIILGGARWWSAEAEQYRSTLFKPTRTATIIERMNGVPTLTMSILDPAFLNGDAPPIMPDHGKLAHMFVVRTEAPVVFAHLHPQMPDGATLRAVLPPLPAGKYRVFNDIVQESGFERTLVDSFTLNAPLDSSGLKALSPDDAWSAFVATRVDPSMNLSYHGDSLFVGWMGNIHPVANEAGVLHFVLYTKHAELVTLEPYLGMLGHAVVMRDDGKVFVHLHPNGTPAMASQTVFALRDRGDTTASGRLKLDDMTMAHVVPTRVHSIDFPYAFPSAGNYYVWVQLRVEGEVHTSGFDVTVAP
ncbi:MAG: hypothetical protein M3Z05_10350 [Gemmatimonadota bacterium]|nr:hypothetical protein [Gemmatimonadota bacterium]